MNIQYSVGNQSAPWDLLMFPVGVVVVYYFALFAFLYQVLTRTDFDTLNRILWVIVIVFVPLLGGVLYLIVTPKAPAAVRHRIISGSDISGTPWADDATHTNGV